MTGVTRQIAAGEYTAWVPVTSHDEVGQLALAFNHMTDHLQRIERLRRTLVSDVAHELRTPLTNLRGYLEALRDEVTEPTQDLFELLHDETLRLVALVEDLLQLTKAEAAVSTLNPQRIVLQKHVGQALEMMQHQFDAKHIKVVDLSAGCGQVISADADKLAQVMRNLLQNAVQYTPRGGQVRIFSEAAADGVKLTVCNSGEGIADADSPYIFERFYRGEKSRSRDHGRPCCGPVEAFRRLEIPEDMQKKHGFAPLGAADGPVKNQIFGFNSARLYNLNLRADYRPLPRTSWRRSSTSIAWQVGSTHCGTTLPTALLPNGRRISKPDLMRLARVLRVAPRGRMANADRVYQSYVV